MHSDGMPLLGRQGRFSLMFFVVASTSWKVAGAAALEDAGRRRLEVEIGSQSLHIHQGGSDQASNIVRREAADEAREDSASSETKVDPPLAQMLIRQNAASQDGAQPFFVGNWNGRRNNWYGDVGISFVPQQDFTIVSLGRHYHNESGITETVPVTLWSVETKTPLAVVNVGPKSFHEGHYMWEPVAAPGVPVSQGREYRLTQACTPGMTDKWFDGSVSYDEVFSNAATGFARFKGGVNESGYDYPENENGQFRRPGMVNFKMAKPPVKITDERGGAPYSANINRVMLWLSFLPVLCCLMRP